LFERNVSFTIIKLKGENKKMKFKQTIVCLTLVVAMLSVMFIAIPTKAAQVDTNSLMTANTVDIQGSSTVYPISVAAKNAFQAKYSGTTINIPAALGSGVGLDALTQISGPVRTDIAASSSIPASKSPLTATADRNYWSTSITMSNGASNDFGMADLRIWPVGKDGVAIVVAANNPYYNQIQKVCNASMVSDLFCSTTGDGLSPIYPTWGSFLTAIGIPSSDSTLITRYVRVASSGTFDGFNTFFITQGNPIGGIARSKTNFLASCTFEDENSQVLTAVSANPSGIAFIGLGFLEDNPTLIKGLWISTGNPASTGTFVEPTRANVLNGSYKYNGYATPTPTTMFRWLWYATNGLPTMGSAGALKTDFVNYVHMNPQYIDSNGYIRMVWSDFTGSTAPSFASQDTPNAAGKLHPNLPDNNVDATDVTYFILAYNAQSAPTNPTMNPLCDYNADHVINAADVTQFILGYNGASSGTAYQYGPATGLTG
jgi:ABC-type phosphate transport system substrate-binding protein